MQLTYVGITFNLVGIALAFITIWLALKPKMPRPILIGGVVMLLLNAALLWSNIQYLARGGQ